VAGILLILWGYFFPKDKNITYVGEKNENSFATMEYISAIENKIRSMTEKITGSTDISVIVSTESGTEYVYVSNEDLNDEKISREYITVKNENGKYELILKKEIYPEIKGVSIVCPGGDNSTVKKKIIDSVSVALGISKNRICIVGTK
jgi:stage III sporulation protein AG